MHRSSPNSQTTKFLDHTASSWCELEWTHFCPFESDRSELKIISDGPGLYCVSVSSSSSLAYIGQTGRNLRERVSGLIRNTLAEKMPFNDPHTAAPRLWSYRIERGDSFEISTAPCTLPKPDRTSLEALLIWTYRKSTGYSPTCNFGRLHPNYLPSRNRSTGIRGERLPDGQVNSRIAPSMQALEFNASPVEPRWMGLEWTKIELLGVDKLTEVPNLSGVYRLIHEQEVIYYGEASKLKSRLRNHHAKSSTPVRFSYAVLPKANAKCQRLEIENDLIAGHFAFTGNAPANQFGAK